MTIGHIFHIIAFNILKNQGKTKEQEFGVKGPCLDSSSKSLHSSVSP